MAQLPKVSSVRRGFALPITLAILAAVVLGVGGILQRAAFQQLAVQRRIDGYRASHAAYSVRTVLLSWFRDQGRDQGGVAAAYRAIASGAPAHRLELSWQGKAGGESGARYTVWIEDGQGVPLAEAPDESLVDPAMHALYTDILWRLPEDAAWLRRPAGPKEISIHAAPPEVLGALVYDEGQAELFSEAVQTARAEADKPLDSRVVTRLLSEAGVEFQETGTIDRVLAYDPTLWRCWVQMEEAGSARVWRYKALVEETRTRVIVRDWHQVLDADADPGEHGTRGPAWADRRRD